MKVNKYEASRIAAEVLLSEAIALDEHRWDDWLALYLPDAEYWVPAWKSESTPTQDPRSEISLIYYSNRRGLEERVMRIRSGKSLASTPLQRTLHTVTNLMIDQADENRITVSAAFQVHAFDPRKKSQHVFFGRYFVSLLNGGNVPVSDEVGGNWLIASKKTLLLNDYIPSMLDVYLI